MAIKSTYTANKVVDDNLTGTYLTLFSDDPKVDGSGTELLVTRQALSFIPAVNGEAKNDTQINYADVPTGTITHWAIYDADVDGNLIYFGKFGSPIIFNESGGQLTIEINDITIKEE